MLKSPDPLPAFTAELHTKKLDKHDTPGLSVLDVNKRSEELRKYVDDITVALHGIKLECEQEAIERTVSSEFPDRIRHALLAKHINKDSEVRHSRPERSRVIYEFCCSDDSMLGNVSAEHSIQCVRLSKSNANMYDPIQIESLCK